MALPFGPAGRSHRRVRAEQPADRAPAGRDPGQRQRRDRHGADLADAGDDHPGTARYRTRGEWRVTGTTDLKAGQTVAIVLGSNPETGEFIGQATIDAAGAFSFKGGVQPVGSGTTVTYISSMGGTPPVRF